MTDASMANLLKILINHNPLVIGIDIYRDVPVPPGGDKLTEIFSRNNNIVSVRKIGDETNLGVAGPYMTRNAEMVGFNDLLVDRDGIIRRGLLFLDDGETVLGSFSLILALRYLKHEGILPEPDKSNPQHLRLGRTTFLPLGKNDGGYVNLDARGYQYLVDFKGAPFQSFTLNDVLSQKIPDKALSGKVVIIGVAAESVKDNFYIPTSKSASLNHVTHGTDVHTFMVSQLLRSALEGSRPLAFINKYYEWIWILAWCLVAEHLDCDSDLSVFSFGS